MSRTGKLALLFGCASAFASGAALAQTATSAPPPSYGQVAAYNLPLIYNPASAVPVLLEQPRTVGAVIKLRY